MKVVENLHEDTHELHKKIEYLTNFINELQYENRLIKMAIEYKTLSKYKQNKLIKKLNNDKFIKIMIKRKYTYFMDEIINIFNITRAEYINSRLSNKYFDEKMEDTLDKLNIKDDVMTRYKRKIHDYDYYALTHGILS